MGNRAQFLIDLDLDVTPIAGHIASDHDRRRPFHGWLELSSAIEQRRRDALATEHLPTAIAGPSRSNPESCDEPPGRGRYRKLATWLGQCTHPPWVVLGAWTCVAWSAAAVVALAATRNTALVAWWAFGLLAMLVLLTFLWTEQNQDVDHDDGGDRPPNGPPEPSSDHEPSGIDWHRLEQEIIGTASGL